MNKFINFMEQKFVPLSNKISTNKYLKSVSGGSMSLLGIIMLGSLFTVLNNIAWAPYQDLISKIGLSTIFGFIPVVTMDMIALYMSYSIAYVGAKEFGVEKYAKNIGFASLMAYVLLIPINFTAIEGKQFIDFEYLGAKGVIVSILVSLITVNIFKYFIKKDITIKMPNGVPQMVVESFIALIPAIATALLFAIIKQGISLTEFGSVQNIIYSLLQKPLQTLTNNLPAFLIFITVAQLLWFFGIHGSMTVLPILFPIFLGFLAENTAAVNAGGIAPNPINFGLYDLANLGGSGATIGLVIVMFLFSKSKRYKVFSRVALPTGLFGVNEPVIFGMPIMLNFVLLIPFLLVPLILVSLAYLLISLNIITPTIGILGAGTLPPFIHGLAQGSLSFGIFEIFAALISALIYYPFFKILDNQALKEEESESLK
ncbi:MAG: PTS sugar transporter subunit IIC [Erysipelotrichaceae bacterium]|nr:PTS sugar transporter subunit IIC [Erysipelotrichaceae bacterium]